MTHTGSLCRAGVVFPLRSKGENPEVHRGPLSAAMRVRLFLCFGKVLEVGLGTNLWPFELPEGRSIQSIGTRLAGPVVLLSRFRQCCLFSASASLRTVIAFVCNTSCRERAAAVSRGTSYF